MSSTERKQKERRTKTEDEKMRERERDVERKRRLREKNKKTKPVMVPYKDDGIEIADQPAMEKSYDCDEQGSEEDRDGGQDVGQENHELEAEADYHQPSTKRCIMV